MANPNPQPAANGRKGTAKAAVAAAALAILANVFGVEGGFVDNRDDPGGATRFGITEAVARADGYTGPMAELPLERAQDILLNQFVIRPGFLALVERQPALAEEIIDSGVNAGPRAPSCWFQQGLNAFNRKGADYPDIAVDCSVGPGTMRAYAALERKRGRGLACEWMLKYLDGRQLEHYAKLARSSSRFETFMGGWMKRIGNVKIEACYEQAAPQ